MLPPDVQAAIDLLAHYAVGLHGSRFVDTDPRGPLRTVDAVERTPAANLVTFAECGHVGPKNATMMVRVGERVRCYDCSRTRQVERLRRWVAGSVQAQVEDPDLSQAEEVEL